MRILITGGGGFVGRRVAALAERCGHEVTRLSIARNAEAPSSAVVTSAGTGRDSIHAALKGRRFDWLLHLASYGVHPGDRDPELMQSINIAFGENLAAVACDLGVRVALATGSSAEYRGPIDRPFRENDPLEENAPYGRTKAIGGPAFHGASRRAGAQGMLMRLFNAYGPGEGPHRLLPSLASRLSENERVALSPGDQVRDFVFVDDVAESLLKACARVDQVDAAAGTYNLSTGSGSTVRSFAEHVAEALKKDPALLDFGAIPKRPHEQMLVVGDARRYTAAFGETLRTPLRQGIEQTLQALGLAVHA